MLAIKGLLTMIINRFESLNVTKSGINRFLVSKSSFIAKCNKAFDGFHGLIFIFK